MPLRKALGAQETADCVAGQAEGAGNLACTQALVAHTIARLQFWNNLGIIYIKDNGQWEEITNAKLE